MLSFKIHFIFILFHIFVYAIAQDFLIRHYAGDVVYNVNGFIDKNRDTLFQDFKRLLYNSSNEIYRCHTF